MRRRQNAPPAAAQAARTDSVRSRPPTRFAFHMSWPSVASDTSPSSRSELHTAARRRRAQPQRSAAWRVAHAAAASRPAAK